MPDNQPPSEPSPARRKPNPAVLPIVAVALLAGGGWARHCGAITESAVLGLAGVVAAFFAIDAMVRRQKGEGA